MTRVADDAGVFLAVHDRGTPTIPANWTPQPGKVKWRTSATSLLTEKTLSAMAAPLGDYGVIYVDRAKGEPFSGADLELLTALANAATLSAA